MNTANRVLWSVIGAVLVLAGVVGILASQGWLAGVDQHRLLFAPDAGDTWNRWGNWAPALAIAAGVILALLGLWLLRAELRVHARPSMPDTDLRTPPRPDGVGGRTQVDTSVLARAMRRDLQSDPAISSAHVRITGRPSIRRCRCGWRSPRVPTCTQYASTCTVPWIGWRPPCPAPLPSTRYWSARAAATRPGAACSNPTGPGES